MKFHVIINLGLTCACHFNLVVLFNQVLQKTPWWMDNMCQKYINTCYKSLHMTKNQPSLTHVISVTKFQLSLT
jgi:hypothetical protein